MAIPESQLETWSHQGAIATAKATHESIRAALTAGTSPVRDKNIEVYLQGSYKNDTNIRGDSDVDVVVQLNSTFQHDLSELSPHEKSLYETAFPNADYFWQNFRADVFTALERYYDSWTVDPGNKAIEVDRASGRLPAHVVPCLQYRKYHYFQSTEDQLYTEGIVFYATKDNRRIINFPKEHYDKGVTKNASSRTDGWYKRVVRMFKNARTYLVDQRVIGEELAPSYFLESLLYNVPDSAFGTNFQTTFYQVVKWLSEAEKSGFTCQNEQYYLFGTSPEQWSISDTEVFIAALATLWDRW